MKDSNESHKMFWYLLDVHSNVFDCAKSLICYDVFLFILLFLDLFSVSVTGYSYDPNADVSTIVFNSKCMSNYRVFFLGFFLVFFPDFSYGVFCTIQMLMSQL